ncbi:MAG: DNA adenine methylase [Pseudomonadota bacterium]|nr:DNA adenine methylase [Pseudomonadota bacterium]
MIASPLRYPGGKAKLFPYVSQLVSKNGLFGFTYCEPYAGGAGLALRLLSEGYVKHVWLNDYDPGIYSFWQSALNRTHEFCDLIDRTEVDIDQWHIQSEVWKQGLSAGELALGFATYFLNRTNRSGIIEGAGPIGGYAQAGDWKLDVRLVKRRQIANLKEIATHRRSIKLSNLDAVQLLPECLGQSETFTYLDPPYYVKGKKLYKNFYNHHDHEEIAEILRAHRSAPWMLSYDDVKEIREIYRDFDPTTYQLSYSAGRKGQGSEVIYASDAVDLPVLEGFALAA